MFRIGEFSILAQVTGRLLRYYDEIGLLIPEYTDPQSGYRSYSARQLPRLNRILVLKELGLSLDQIARLLDQDLPAEELRGMLTLRRAQIERALDEERARLNMIQTRLEQIDTHGQMQEPDVILKAVAAQPFLALREVLPDLDAVRRRVMLLAEGVPAALGTGHLGQLAIVIRFEVYDPDALDFEIGYLLTGKTPPSLRLPGDRTLSLSTLPAVETMATLLHVGQVSDIHQSYGLLGGWIERQGWRIAGMGRQLFMQLPMSSPQAEAVIELQLPVSRVQTSPRSA
ncbi:MerR family transcriptional regulator [Deinococcus sp.]|uniref:MerR family transcriptional regulator n=1 Tax=Deinococcus sp. TaxID=47478 RepID=UPI003CC6C0B2